MRLCIYYVCLGQRRLINRHSSIPRQHLKGGRMNWITKADYVTNFTKYIKKARGLVVSGSTELFQICRVQRGRGKTVSLVEWLEMTLSKRVRNDVFKPLKMFNSKRASELSCANICSQWLRLVKANLKLVTASQRAMPNFFRS